MYEDLFQTPDRPFRATPDVRFYFPFNSMEQTRQTALRVIRRAEGPAAIMGGVGLGKTMLAQLLAEDLQDRFDVVRLHAARLCSRRAMLQNILFELQLPYRELSEGELRLSLMERMEPSPAHAADGLVLVVDEAQTLPTKLLEELRLITNFTRQGQARARLLLMGNLQLEETLALPEMSSFNQRLAARCFLQPMNRAQTADFVRHQFTCAGVDPKQIITRDAMENVYVASEGIPRLANQVMDHALILAIANDQYPISASLIQEAWSDLQQLPMTWSQNEPAGSTPVEFGSIDDLDQDFEMEPEGAEDLDVATHSSISWPALGDLGPADNQDYSTVVTHGLASGSSGKQSSPRDLEDFGPDASMSSPDMPDLASFYTHETVVPMNPVASDSRLASQSTARVVFDASVMFAKTDTTSAHVSSISGANVDPRMTASRNASVQAVSAESMGQDVGDQDMFVFAEEEETATEPSTMNRNMFAAWNPLPESTSYELDLMTSDSLRQNDDNDMQAYFDAMEPMAIPMPLARVEEVSAGDPFGQDFDEEFTVEATDVLRWQQRQRQRAEQSTSVAHSSAMNVPIPSSNDYNVDTTAHETSKLPLQSMPASADKDTIKTTNHLVTEEIIHRDAMPVESLVVQPEYAGLGSDVITMTASGTIDYQLNQEIEDLISQLNFSAFSVEMDSVEQISPDFLRQAASAMQLESGSDNDYPDTLPLHRTDVAPDIGPYSMDDDRDLLIIEEEVPASVRHQSVPVTAPAVGTMSYPQLFQQLRG